VAAYYDWSGYLDCQREKALILVLAKDHLEAALFDFRTKTAVQTIVPANPPSVTDWWHLSPNARFAIRVERDMGEYHDIKSITSYDLSLSTSSQIALPRPDGSEPFITWRFERFLDKGDKALFTFSNKAAIVDLPSRRMTMIDLPVNGRLYW
jgi:hypothetical protein